MLRKRKYFLHLCLQEDGVDNFSIILKQNRDYTYGKGELPETFMTRNIVRNRNIAKRLWLNRWYVGTK